MQNSIMVDQKIEFVGKLEKCYFELFIERVAVYRRINGIK